jgi:hypothetical protein
MDLATAYAPIRKIAAEGQRRDIFWQLVEAAAGSPISPSPTQFNQSDRGGVTDLQHNHTPRLQMGSKRDHRSTTAPPSSTTEEATAGLPILPSPMHVPESMSRSIHQTRHRLHSSNHK